MALRKKNIVQYINFQLIGISSHQHDFSFVWAVNKSTGFSFVKQDDILIRFPDTDNPGCFSRFTYVDEVLQLAYDLLANRCDNGFLLSDLTTIDFIVKITGAPDQRDIETLIAKLRKAPSVIACFRLPAEKIRDIDRLLF